MVDDPVGRQQREGFCGSIRLQVHKSRRRQNLCAEHCRRRTHVIDRGYKDGGAAQPEVGQHGTIDHIGICHRRQTKVDNAEVRICAFGTDVGSTHLRSFVGLHEVTETIVFDSKFINHTQPKHGLIKRRHLADVRRRKRDAHHLAERAIGDRRKAFKEVFGAADEHRDHIVRSPELCLNERAALHVERWFGLFEQLSDCG